MHGLWKILATASAMSFLLGSLPTDRAVAAPRDYRFETNKVVIRPGAAAFVTVRLVHGLSERPVANATIIESRLAMPMQGMSSMSGRARLVSSDGNGAYRFAVDAPMRGDWLLFLSASVPGEATPAQGVVGLRLEPQVSIGRVSPGSDIVDNGDDPEQRLAPSPLASRPFRHPAFSPP